MRTVDTTTYDKHAAYPNKDQYGNYHGYDSRDGVRPSSIVVHTTNGNKGSSFSAEANYLKNSPDVSAHYLIGKEGQIAQILTPDWEAWHAGKAVAAYQNLYSIGIECHHAIGDSWPQAQFDALTWVVERLMAQFLIATTKIETHRYAAIPGPTTTSDQSQWRKSDPNDWSDSSFYSWRGGLRALPFELRVLGTPVYQREDCTGPLWGYLVPGDLISIDKTYNGERAHLADGRGFIWLNESVQLL